VAPSGYLYKCWEETTPDVEGSVGNIFSDGDMEDFQQGNLWNFTSFDPLENPDCAVCDILPRCMGACPLDTNLQTAKKNLECSFWRSNYFRILKLQNISTMGEEVRQ
jgi:uncharacterized protein